MGKALEVGIMNNKIDQRLYQNAVLYFIKYCNNRYLHRTKLNKLLYYFDFISYRDSKESVTKDIYIHEQFGPVPQHAGEILAQLKQQGAIETKASAHKDGEMISFELKDESQLDESVFSKEQKRLLKEICNEFGSWSTEKIVAQTHLEAPWFYSKPYDTVDYAYAQDIGFFRK